jgi:hypothetical protein
MNKDYNENVDTLVTFGDEGLTLRKDDKKSKKYIEKMQLLTQKSIFEGINLSEKRDKDETYENYKDRLKLNKNLLKIYKQNGIDKSWELFPNGFKTAVEDTHKEMKKPKMTATVDGKEIPVIINNDKDE